MPTYDYVCRACQHRFEHFQSMQDALLRKCPECGKLKLERLIGSGAGILFKGSGFYETDYKRKSSGGSPGTAGAPASDGSGSAGPKEPGAQPKTGGSTDTGSGPAKGGSTPGQAAPKSET